MRVGITGHVNLTPESVPLVATGIGEVLSEQEGPLVGVSCLARGADQVFARARGIPVTVVWPEGAARG